MDGEWARALSGAVGAVRALRWVAVVRLQEQQVACVLGFVLRGVPGASGDRVQLP